jgi:hypothetical protein
MNRCPKCHRFGICYDNASNHERCVWKNCGWVNELDIDLDKVKHPLRFWKFINAIKRKIEL